MAGEPLSGGSLVGVNNGPDVAVVMTWRSGREVPLVSTVVRLASARLHGPAPGAELAPTGTREAEAPLDSVVETIVRADAASV
jgi:hypothetical protein